MGHGNVVVVGASLTRTGGEGTGYGKWFRVGGCGCSGMAELPSLVSCRAGAQLAALLRRSARAPMAVVGLRLLVSLLSGRRAHALPNELAHEARCRVADE